MNTTAILLMEIYHGLGCTVSMLDIANEGKPDWKKLPIPNTVTWVNAYQARGIDLLIDIDATQTRRDRGKIATTSVVFLRTFLQFSELQMSAYMETPYLPRDLEEVREVWCWDVMNPEETLDSVAMLFPCPIRRMPFSWSASIIRSLYDSSEFKHRSSHIKEIPWTVHVAERNKDNQSTSVMPMVAIRELFLKRVIDAQYLIHDMDHVKENRFLKENVLINIQSETLPLQMVPASSYQNWLEMPNQVLFSHIRFQPIRFAVLNAIWLGIPVVHNSPVLKQAHPLLENLYYKGNDVHEIVESFQWLTAQSSLWYTSIPSLRQWMEETYAWNRLDALPIWKETLNGPSVEKKPISVEANVPINEPKKVSFAPCSKDVVVAFSDMWPGFHVDRNFLMDALRHEFPSHSIKGVAYESGKAYSLLIFGPYGETWKTVSSTIPKVYFSAENWDQPDDSSIACYLTPSRKEDDRHLRVPTWAMFIDWFSGATELPPDSTDNPIRLPLHFATTPHSIPWSTRNEFCAFVVSNPICEFRNEAFRAVNEYKKVSSGGALFNNIGGQLSLKYPGGGCGDLSKHDFFTKHRYTISFENSQAPGYITEKLLHAKMAGCLPLYWGDAEAHLDFVPESFVNLSAVKDPAVVVQIIKKLEANPEMCAKMAATPLLDKAKCEVALSMQSVICQRLMSLISSTPPASNEGPMEGIKTAYVVNLDSRTDRWNSLIEAEPWIKTHAERTSAVHGKTIQMTPIIYDLFEHNNFNWKKSIMGCSLSHIKLWSKIAASETLQPNDKILILEDDVRFRPHWRTQWKEAVRCIPEDADLLYLGGVLPPNKAVLSSILEPSNPYWASIRPNTFFSPVELPMFHFCTYSYILTPLGAQKLVVGIMESKEKAPAAIDHILGHPGYQLKTYVATPLLTECFQENDPAYVQSNFNQIDGHDTFDSDIRNNTESFTEEELAPFRSSAIPSVPSTTMDLYYYEEPDKPFDLYERKWLEFVFGRKIECKPYRMGDNPPADNAWYMVQRPYSEEWSNLFYLWNEKGVSFRVLHLSDEFISDTITFYSLPRCKAVVRNYLRDDLPRMDHILTIPLGYHHKSTDPQKTWEERHLLWSFHGTDWFHRGKQLSAFSEFVPNSCRLLPSWNHATMTGEQDYLKLLNDTKFCPILKGNHYETFRLYEALEAGALPITTITDVNYLTWVEEHLGLEQFYLWNKPTEMLRNPTAVDELVRTIVQQKWGEWKKKIQEACQRLL